MDNLQMLLGFQLEEAVKILEGKKLKYCINETFSPKVKDRIGESRVINIKNENNIIELIVSYF
ncbi:hypothetical protein [Anaeromicrobium sediminis]|uniref:Uncharacterized protein n=1 Tax=Anaeromicrobium sediminis TaxID=1478221 RepID=A0A267MNY6_9FIRM|nr:hypothetical protein [Anaeromicrobium sediminis]PAB61236.1 hypothetical protein CCE28_02065 [Anaeromicrobium sediminis]